MPAFENFLHEPARYLDAMQARARAVYTDPRACLARLHREPDPIARLEDLAHVSRVATSPMGRFGLESRASIPAPVRAVIRHELRQARRTWRPVRRTIENLRGQGLAWDEVWSIVQARHGVGGAGLWRLLGTIR